jgi:hypothetical protein
MVYSWFLQALVLHFYLHAIQTLYLLLFLCSHAWDNDHISHVSWKDTKNYFISLDILQVHVEHY